MTKLHHLTIEQALDGLKKRDFTAVELTQAHIEAMQKAKHLNAYITETPELALKAAHLSDERYASNNPRKLEGIPLGIKDLFCTQGVLTTAGSHMLHNFKPTYESTVSQKLFETGGIMLGKTNMDEFAMGSSNKTSYFGPVINPWKSQKHANDLVPGGSSGGSAVAVSAYMAMGTLGSDTGGSIRQPAAFCGIVGIKPTYGRCSRYGMVAFASSLDQAGVFTRTITDAALFLEPLMGHDPKDSTSATSPVPDLLKNLKRPIKGLKVGIPHEYQTEGIPHEIKQIWEQGANLLKSLGAEIIDIHLPHTAYALPTYYIIAPAEASSNLARYDGVRYGLRVTENTTSLDEMYEQSRAAGFGDEVKRRIMIGTYALSSGYYDAYYKKAQKVRTLISNDFMEAFKSVDVILTPTTPSAAFALNETITDPVQMYLNDVFTIPASLAGLPALSLPIGLSSDHLPLGLHLIGKPFDEATLLQAGYMLEEAVQFKAQPTFVA